MPTRRLLAVLAAICALLGLHVLPASAAKDVGTTTAAGESESSPQTTRRAERAAERAAAKAEAAPTASTPASPPAEAPAAGPPAHGHHGTPPPPPAPAGQGTAPVSHKGEHSGSQSHAQRREERRAAGSSSASASTGAASGATSSADSEAASAQAESLARKQKKEKGGGQKGKKERKEKGKKSTHEEKTEGSGQEGSGQEGTGAEGSSGKSVKAKGEADSAGTSGAGVAAAASLGLPGATPAGGTGSASISAALPAAKTGLSSGAATSRAKHHAAGKRHKGTAGAAGAAAGAAAVALPSAALAQPSGSPASGSTRSQAKHSEAPSNQPALVKTFTKIVGVVPTPVRILIGALILLALLLGARSLLSGARTRRLKRQRGQLLEDVGLLQAALLPDPPARLGPVATSAAYRPADGPGAGGDFYDVFALADGEIAVLVGDVSGHGREALPHTALLRFTVRAYLEAGLSPREALQTAGKVLEHQLGDSFATVVAATYNPRERRLTYASAGHPPPVVLGDESEGAIATVTACSAPPLGAGLRTGTRQTVVSVPGPARLCFHTDGVTEARVGEELFGAGRLADELEALPHEDDAKALLQRVAERTDARPDDMAACLLRIHDGQGAPAIALEQLELDGELAAGQRVERFLFDWGLSAAEARGLLREARTRLRHEDTVLLELVPSPEGSAVARLAEQNVIRPAALARAGA